MHQIVRERHKERQKENESKKEKRWEGVLDRCRILSQQIVELEGKRTNGREKERERELHRHRVTDEDMGR